MDLRGKQRHDTDFGCVVASARPTNVLSQVFSHGVEWRTPDRATVVSLSLSLPVSTRGKEPRHNHSIELCIGGGETVGGLQPVPSLGP